VGATATLPDAHLFISASLTFTSSTLLLFFLSVASAVVEIHVSGFKVLKKTLNIVAHIHHGNRSFHFQCRVQSTGLCVLLTNKWTN
jgi:hypothetical protein